MNSYTTYLSVSKFTEEGAAAQTQFCICNGSKAVLCQTYSHHSICSASDWQAQVCCAYKCNHENSRTVAPDCIHLNVSLYLYIIVHGTVCRQLTHISKCNVVVLRTYEACLTLLQSHWEVCCPPKSTVPLSPGHSVPSSRKPQWHFGIENTNGRHHRYLILTYSELYQIY